MLNFCSLFSGGEGDATEEERRDGDSAAQKRALGALPDAVRPPKKSSTPVASDTTAKKDAADKNKGTMNRNLAQGKGSDAVSTATSYFDPVWNAFLKHTDGSMQWFPKQIVAICEDFHTQVGDGKVRTTHPIHPISESKDYSSDSSNFRHRTRAIWSSTISEVDLITKKSQVD